MKKSEIQNGPFEEHTSETFKFEVVTVDEIGRIVRRETGKVQYFAEDLGNGIKLDMVAIPGGTFLMGTDRWQRPVEGVSWEDAKEFCARLSKKTGREYRLPTEAEWEYACRAGTDTPFHFGETISTDLANYRGTDWECEGKVYPGNYGRGLKGIYREQTTPVGYFKVANNFGLYDMHGNVWEWCEDNWHGNYEGAPIDCSAWVSEISIAKVVRGGSWYYDPRDCRSAIRNINSRVNRNFNIGVRVVCVVSRTT